MSVCEKKVTLSELHCADEVFTAGTRTEVRQQLGRADILGKRVGWACPRSFYLFIQEYLPILTAMFRLFRRAVPHVIQKWVGAAVQTIRIAIHILQPKIMTG